MLKPPSTVSMVPVMYEASSALRNRTARLTSSGRPSRATGFSLAIVSGSTPNRCHAARAVGVSMLQRRSR